MTDTTQYPELDMLLDEAFRGQDRVSSDELRRRAVAADLSAEPMSQVDALPEGEYDVDEVAEALRASGRVDNPAAVGFPDGGYPDFAEEHDDTTVGNGLSDGSDRDDLEPESPRGLGGMDIPPRSVRER